jgi:hypothetical protein
LPYYELHITIAEKDQLETFQNHCRTSLLAKANLIELNQGSFPLQLMLAKKGILNTDAEALEWGEITTSFIEIAGWTPIRCKVESELNEGPSVYFEAHWKFDLNYPHESRPQASWDSMKRALGEFSVTSRRWLRSRNLGHPGVYYLSQRSYQPDYKVAMEQFDAAHRQIVDYLDYVVPLDGVHYERVISDTNPTVDQGWAS